MIEKQHTYCTQWVPRWDLEISTFGIIILELALVERIYKILSNRCYIIHATLFITRLYYLDIPLSTHLNVSVMIVQASYIWGIYVILM